MNLLALLARWQRWWTLARGGDPWADENPGAWGHHYSAGKEGEADFGKAVAARREANRAQLARVRAESRRARQAQKRAAKRKGDKVVTMPERKQA